MARTPLIDYAADRREAAAQRWLELQEALRRVKPRYYSVPQAVGALGRDRFIVAVSENTTNDPAVEKAWQTTCPPQRRFYKAFIPERHATVFGFDEETGEVSARPLNGKLFYRRLGEAELIIRGFEIIMISASVIQQRQDLYAKELLGCVTFANILPIDFSWTLQDAQHMSEIHSYDQQRSYRLLRALGADPDAKFDPGGIEDLTRWPD